MNLLDKKCGYWAAMTLRFRAAHLLPASSVALVTLLVSSAAVAQGSGVLTGTVIDSSTKKGLGDVVVTLTSPALQGEQTVVTDASGSYRIPNLPSGDYVLRLDRDAFRPYSRGGITMRVDATIRVNAELLPESIKGEEVVVIGKAPTVDIGSSSTGVTITREFLNKLPLNPGSGVRSFEDLGSVAPGAQADAFGVGFSGTTSPENAFIIDGVAVNDPAFGINGTPLSVEFVKEIGIISGGYMPEYGRATGGIMDVVTKSGSNDFHGSVWLNITPGGLEGRRTIVLSDASSRNTDPSLSSVRDFGGDLGGAIVKDKLWFYAGFQAALNSQNTSYYLKQFKQNADGSFIADPSTGFYQANEIPGTRRSYRTDTHTAEYFGKLTYLFNQDHQLTLSTTIIPSGSQGNVGPQRNLATTALSNSDDVSLKYSGAFNNKTQLLDVTLGWHHQHSGTFPADGSAIGSQVGQSGIAGVIYRRTSPDYHSVSDFEYVPAGYCHTVNGITPCPSGETYGAGGPGFLEDVHLSSYQAKAVLTNLLTLAGHHVIKAGVDVTYSTYEHEKAYSGRTLYEDSAGGTNFNDLRQFGYLTAPDQEVSLDKYTARTNSVIAGGFLQDSWQIMDKVTLNAGLRYDAQVLYGADGNKGLVLPNQWSPRVGVIYDFTQQGRGKVFANYARFYEGVPLDIADRGFPGEASVGARHSAAACNPAATFVPDPTDPTKIDPCKDPNNLVAGYAGYGNAGYNPNQKYQRSGDREPVDPDISPQSSDEFVVGAEYEIIPGGRISGTFTHRYMVHVIEDMSRDEANTYFIGNPGYGIAKDFPKATRDYDAGSFAFTKTFENTWLVQASYTISYLRGNYAGLFRPETLQLDPNGNSDFDLRSLLPNRTGPLPGDSTHQIKLYGAKDFILPNGMDVLVGATYRVKSGGPRSYLGAHPIYGADEVFILPRGDAGRDDWVHNFDARVGFSVPVGNKAMLGITLDVFNLFNFQAATSRDNSYTTTDVKPIDGGTVADLGTKLIHSDGTPFDPKTEKNPNFGNPTSYQNPRQFRFGAKITF